MAVGQNSMVFRLKIILLNLNQIMISSLQAKTYVNTIEQVKLIVSVYTQELGAAAAAML